jgi:hypothetical protein
LSNLSTRLRRCEGKDLFILRNKRETPTSTNWHFIVTDITDLNSLRFYVFWWNRRLLLPTFLGLLVFRSLHLLVIVDRAYAKANGTFILCVFTSVTSFMVKTLLNLHGTISFPGATTKRRAKDRPRRRRKSIGNGFSVAEILCLPSTPTFPLFICLHRRRRFSLRDRVKVGEHPRSVVGASSGSARSRNQLHRGTPR